MDRKLVLKKEVDWGVMAMMIDPASFREAFKKATINEIIKERDKMRAIGRFLALGWIFRRSSKCAQGELS